MKRWVQALCCLCLLLLPLEVMAATLLAEYRFEESGWNGTANELKDASGNNRHGQAIGSPLPVPQDSSRAIPGPTGTCSSSQFFWPRNGGSAFSITGLPVNTTAGAKTSVSFWMYWDGADIVMPIGWNRYDVMFSGAHFGFNTGNGDLYGMSSIGLNNRWVHVVAVFTNGNVTGNEIYIDGVKQILSQRINSPDNVSAVVGGSMRISGWGLNSEYRFRGYLDQVEVLNGAVTQAEVDALFAETQPCKAKPAAVWHMDESNWWGRSGEVVDTSVSAANGQAVLGAVTTTGKVCRAGNFNKNYVEVADAAKLRLSTNYTLTAWIKTTKASGIIAGKGQDSSPWPGYAFGLGPATGGKLALFNGNGSWFSSSGAAVNDGNWHFVAVTVEGITAKFYVDGVQDGGVVTLPGNTTATNLPFRIGMGAGSDLNSQWSFVGQIDEVQLFNDALPAGEISRGYNEQLNGRYWDGSAALCSRLVAEYRMDEPVWNGTTNELLDSSGNNRHGRAIGSPVPVVGRSGPALSGSAGTCGYAELQGGSSGGSAFQVTGLLVPANAGEKITVSFWMYWNGTENIMPVGWTNYYSLYFTNGTFGFYSGGGIYGISSSGLANGWHHVVAVFTRGNRSQNQLFINGQERVLTQIIGGGNDVYSIPSSTMTIGGWATDPNNRFKSRIDEVQIYSGALSAEHAQILFQERHPCAAQPVADWRLDELGWTGRGSEVMDNTTNVLHGQAVFGADTSGGKVCRAGSFDKNYVEVADSAKLRLTSNYTLSAWIKTTQATGIILGKGQDSSPYPGYAFGLGPNTGGKLAIYNGNGSWFTSSGSAVNDGQWHHVAVSVDGTRAQFYVDGVVDGGVIDLPAITSTTTLPFRIGMGASSDTQSQWAFNGQIDEILLFDNSLSAAEIATGYANQNAGKTWDGLTASCTAIVGEYHLDETIWNGTTAELKDSSGNNRHGRAIGSPVPIVGRSGPAISGNSGTCGYAELGGSTSGGSAFQVDGLPVPASTGGKITVSFWMYWNGTENIMPIGWTNYYSLYFTAGTFGFYSGGGIYGISSSGLANGWHHVVAVFTRGNRSQNQLFINGQERVLSQVIAGGNDVYSIPSSTMIVGGWATDANNRFKSRIDEVKVIGGGITTAEVGALYNERHPCGIQPVADWRFDELSWAGRGSEAMDSSANLLHGQSIFGANTTTGKVCRAGNFDKNYVEVPDNIKLRVSGSYTLSAWIKTTKATGIILGKSQDNSPYPGFAFGLGPDSGGKLAINNGNGSWFTSSGAVVNDGLWHHVAVTVDGTRARFYVDGVADGAMITLPAVTTTSTLPLRIGMGAGSDTNSQWSFSGQIDEVLVFDTPLTAVEVARTYTNQNAGKTWDGQSSSCSALLGEYRMDEPQWNGVSGELRDSSGNNRHGYATGSPLAIVGRSDPAISGTTGTCSYAELSGSTSGGSAFQVDGLPVPANAGDKISVSFWMYWDGTANVMPVGWGNNYSLYITAGTIGFYSGGGIYGLASTGLNNGWHHVVAVFTRGNRAQNQLFINGQERVLSQVVAGGNDVYSVTSASLTIGGWTTDINNRFKSRIDEVKVFNGSVTAAQADTLYRERHPCAAQQVADWHFDESSWDSHVDEITDSAVHGLHGKAFLGANTTTGKVCRAGNFSRGYAQVNDHAKLQLGPDYTLTAWVKTTDATGHLIWKYQLGTGFPGYGLALNPDGGGKLSFWNGTGTWYNSTGTVINDGNWHFVAVTVKGNSLRFYVDGQPDSLVITMSGNTVNSSAPLRFGGRLDGAANDYKGQIDEVLLFDATLSPAEILAGYTNQNNGKAWDGLPALCSMLQAEYRFEEPQWNGRANELIDSSGKGKHGYAIGNPNPISGNLEPARPGATGTCNYAEMKGGISGGTAFQVTGLPAALTTGDKTSISFWMYWDGTNAVMPIGWDQYDLYLYNNAFGFHVGGGVYGIPSAGLANGWVHVVAVFSTRDAWRNRLFINGEERVLSQQIAGGNNVYAVPNSSIVIGGWLSDANQRFRGRLDEVKIFSGQLSAAQVRSIYRDTHDCPTAPIAEWNMDESTWDSHADEVTDSAVNGFHGQAFLGATTTTGKVCRAGDFKNNYVQVADNSKLRLSAAYTISAWVKTSKGSGNVVSKIMANSPWSGFNFGLDPAGSGRLALWNGTTWSVSTGAAVNDNSWHHIAVSVDGLLVQFYIDGLPSGNVITMSTLTATNSSPLLIGYDGGTGANPANLFEGQIDELLLFDSALSLNEIAAGYANQSAGKNWDGLPSLCSMLQAEYRFEEPVWSAQAGELKDSSGNNRHGRAIGNPLPSIGTTSPARSGATGTCNYAVMNGSTANGSAFQVDGLVRQLNNTDKTTISFWMYWDGTNAVMPVGWDQYDLYLYNGAFGFHMGGGVYGINSTGLANGWHHVVAIFSTRDAWHNQLFINGEERILTQQIVGGSNIYAVPGSTIVLGGWTSDSNQRFRGRIDEFKIFNGQLTAAQVRSVYRDTHDCNSLPVADWRMDETSWDGHANEVMDSSSNQFHGLAVLGADTVSGKVCRAADFKQNYVQVADNVKLRLSAAYTISAWVKTSKGSGNVVSKILANSPWSGFNFGLDPNGSGRLALWNGSQWLISTGAAVNDNSWHQVAVSVDGLKVQFYVDGLPSGNVMTMTALTTTNSSPLLIGYDGGSGASPANFFEGQIDELLMFDSALSRNEIAAGYTNQAAGRTWDGQASLCSMLHASYSFDEERWTGQPDELKDSAGGNRHGRSIGLPAPIAGRASPARGGYSGTCGYAEMTGAVSGGSAFQITSLLPQTTTGNKTTISFWMYWDGTNAVMPLGWDQYDLYLYNGAFGFHVGGGVYGISSAGLANGWHHVVAVFTTRDAWNNQLFINGEERILTQQIAGGNNVYAVPSSNIVLGGWTSDANQRFRGRIDEVRIYNGQVSAAHVRALYRETHRCPAQPVAEWHLDEPSWNRIANEVMDDRPSALHGIARLGAKTDPGKVCRAGTFKENYVEVPHHAKLDLSVNYTISAWIKTTKASGTIVSKTNPTGPWAGYAFAIGPDSGGKLALWNGGGWTVNSGAAVNDGNWHFVAVSVEGTVAQFFIDGVPSGGPVNLPSVTNTNTQPLRIGLEHEVGAKARHFDGQIDEVLIFDQPLSKNEIAVGYANQNSGLSWDGSKNLCSMLAAEYRMEELLWNGTSGEFKDSSGNNKNGVVVGTPMPNPATTSPARGSDSSGTCGYAEFRGPTANGGAFLVSGMPAPSAVGDRVSISFWMYWDGTNAVMPIGWDQYDLYIVNGAFGFHVGGGVYGIASTGLANGWQHVVAVFVKGNSSQNQLYINGEERVLSQQIAGGNNVYANPASNMLIGGWTSDSNQRFKGRLDEVKVFNGHITAAQAKALFQEIHPCPSKPLAEWQLDELSWTGAPAEVKDSRTLMLDGSAKLGALNAAAKVCRGATLNQNYLEMQHSTAMQLTADYTIAAWVKTSKVSGTIVANEELASPWQGYVFAIGPDSGGKLSLWSGQWYTSSGAAVNDGNWHHVAVAVSENSIQFYVDGQPNGSRITMTAAETSSIRPIRIGMQNSPGAEPRAFNGQIDEVLLFDRGLSATAINTGFNHQAAGRNWDGSANMCSMLLAQYRMEDGSWNGTAGELKDSSGNARHGVSIGSPRPSPDSFAPAKAGGNGTCGYANMPGPVGNGGAFSITGLPVPTTANSKTTVSFWMYWDGTNAVMPIGWDQYDLYLVNGAFGFHVGGGIYGISSTGLANGWNHVVAVFTKANSAQNQLYINGEERVLSQQIAGGNNVYANPASNMTFGGWTSDTNQRFKGRLDELKVFNGGLSSFQAKQLYNETHACPPAVHHVRIDHNPEDLTCTGASVTLFACASNDTNGLCTPDISGISGNVLAKSSGNVTLATVPFSIPAGSSSVTVNIPVTTAQTVNFEASNLSPTPNYPFTCWNGSSASCSHGYKDTGFQFDVNNHVAESAQTLTVTAVKKASSGSACVPALANRSNVNVNFKCNYSNPNTGSLAARVGGVALNASANSGLSCDSGGNNVNLSFNASGVATTSFHYADVGRMLLTASFTDVTDTGSPNYSNTDSFITAPKDFLITNLSSTPIKAGNNFSASVTARNQANATTPNFGKELVAEGVNLSFARSKPTGTGAANGTFSGNVGAFTAGVATGTNFNWSEVGMMDISASLASGNYLGSGLSASGSTASNTPPSIGPFIPDHFDVVLTAACSAGNFTYAGQPFTVQISAKNGLSTPTTTLNYDGSGTLTPAYAKTLTLSEVSGATGSLNNTSIAASSFVAGVANLNRSFSFADKETAPANIKLRVIDSDNVSSATGSEPTSALRSGRVRLINANGQASLALAVPIRLEYWNGTHWVKNSSDSCTTLTNSNFAFTFPTGTGGKANLLAACETALSIGGTAPDYSLMLTAPGNSNRGWARLTLNLSGSLLANGNNRCTTVGGAGGAETPAALPWLQYNWTASSNNPSSLVSFGITRANRLLYRREIY